MAAPHFKSKLSMCHAFLFVTLLVPLASCQDHLYSITVSKSDITVIKDTSEPFNLILKGLLEENLILNFTFKKEHEDLIELKPQSVQFPPTVQSNSTITETINIIGLSPGHLQVTAETDKNQSWITDNVFLRVTVANSRAIIYISITFGWIYFVAWSVSFYPQIYVNFRRKSVVGLNFDFLALNIVGFFLYGIFNIGLYWVPGIQNEYSSRNPTGLNPVLLNDVVFSLHAMFATGITIVQCFVYERDLQRVSITARGILAIFLSIVLVSGGLAAGGVVHWLDFLYYCSYVKLSITLIKYIPQAVMNYRRKSTIGWSIGNILLDFVGGTLSMLQMILNAYNYDDWASIFGDPTKFGLGLFSVLFDIFFMLQHYVFYRNSTYESIPGSDDTNDEHEIERMSDDPVENFSNTDPVA